MRKHGSNYKVWLKGSRRMVERTVYTDGQNYFIKWYGNYIAVKNASGFNNVTSGWVTVEEY